MAQRSGWIINIPKSTMKTVKYCLLAGGALVLAAGHGLAQSASAWYVNGGVGPAIAQDNSIRQSAFGYSGNVRFDTGIRGDIDLGYQFKPSWAAELEVGALWNGVHSIAGNTPDEGASADLYQMPILAKLVYKPCHGKLQPYLGVGVGTEASIFDMSNVSTSSSIGLYAPSFDSLDWSFAYQGEAGVRWQIAHNLDLGLGYKFLGTTDHNWSDHGVTLATGELFTHAIEVSLTWHF